MIPGPYRNLALIGFMGSGKTTAAGTIAGKLGWRAVDADAEIEREAGRSITEIFATDGEPTFRALEERVCLRLLHQTGVVVALGGGAVTSPLIRERLRDGSFTVLLDVSPQTAWRRIEQTAGDRPLAAEARGFAELYEARRGCTTPPRTRSWTRRSCTARSRCWRPSPGRAPWPSWDG